MIIYCEKDGSTTSVPSSIPYGSANRELIIFIPKMVATVSLRLNPPNAEYPQEIMATPVIEGAKEDASLFKVKIPKEVASSLPGRVEYQVVAYAEDGEEIPFEAGSYNIRKGVYVEAPQMVEDFENYNIANLYELLVSVIGSANKVTDIEALIGLDDGLHTDSKTIVGAINELHKGGTGGGVPVDPTFELEGYAADAKLVGERFQGVYDDIGDINDNITNIDLQVKQNDSDIETLIDKVDTLEKESEEMAEAITNQGVLIAQQAKDSKQYTDTALANLVDSAPAELDTLRELATALGENKNLSQTILQQLSSKADFGYVDDGLAAKVNTGDIVDSLDSTDTNKPLSAAKGKELNEAIQSILENGVGDALAGEVIIRDGSTNEAVENAIAEHYNGKNLFFEIAFADGETEKCALIGINNMKGLLFFITTTTKEIVTVSYSGTDYAIAVVSFTPLSIDLADDLQDYDKAARASMVGDAVAELQRQIDGIDTSDGIVIDTTLQNSGEAADAKAVGDKIAEVEEAVVKRDGAEMLGDFKTQDIYPKSTAEYSLGKSDRRYKEIHGNAIYEAGTAISQKYITDINAKKYTDDKVAEVGEDVSKNAEDIDDLKTRVGSVEEFNVNTYNTLNTHTGAINSLGERVTALEGGDSGSVSEEVLETFEFITEADIDEICGSNIQYVSFDKGAF